MEVCKTSSILKPYHIYGAGKQNPWFECEVKRILFRHQWDRRIIRASLFFFLKQQRNFRLLLYERPKFFNFRISSGPAFRPLFFRPIGPVWLIKPRERPALLANFFGKWKIKKKQKKHEREKSPETITRAAESELRLRAKPGSSPHAPHTP